MFDLLQVIKAENSPGKTEFYLKTEFIPEL